MILKEMYPGMDNSPDTKLTATIGPTDTVISVENVGVFPDGPNYAVIGNDNDAELIKYAVKTTNSLSGCTRGFGALPAKAWQSGESIARNITNTDLMNLIDNILTLDNGKQDTLTAGTNVTIDESNVISATDTTYEVATTSANGLMASADKVKLNGKQDPLIAGANVTISGTTISATDTKYTAGTNVTITGTTISAKDTIYDDTPLKTRITAVENREDKDTTYTAGTNVQISAGNVISATDTKYTAGTNVTISGNSISATDTTYGLASASDNGLMASADKIKMVNIEVNGIKVYASTDTIPTLPNGVVALIYEV